MVLGELEPVAVRTALRLSARLSCLDVGSIGIRERVTRHITFALVSSGALYALALFVIGIAHEYRYIYWTMLTALIATPGHCCPRRGSGRTLPALLRFGPLGLIVVVILLRELVVRFAL